MHYYSFILKFHIPVGIVTLRVVVAFLLVHELKKIKKGLKGI